MASYELTADGKLRGRAGDRLSEVLRCPFATTAELHALNGSGDPSSVHRGIQALRRDGLIDGVSWHSAGSSKPSMRHFATTKGLRELSERLGIETKDIVRRYAASAEWQSWFLGHMELVALVYALAVQVAGSKPPNFLPVRVRFPRAGPLDGVISFSDGLSFSVMRQGSVRSAAAFAKRVSNQGREKVRPALLLLVAADDFSLPQVLERLRERRATLTGAVATEEDALSAGADAHAWCSLNHGNERLSLADLVAAARDPWRQTPHVRTDYVKAGLPSELRGVPEKSLVELTAVQRRTLLDVFRWPLKDTRQLAALHGISYSNEARILKALLGLDLVETVRVPCLPRARFAFSDEGLRYLSDRDRLDLAALRRRWSTGSGDRPRGTILAKLIRESDHTEGINDFVYRLASEFGPDIGLLPAHLSTREFTLRGRVSQVVPDVVATISGPHGPRTLFVEYEMRAGSVRDLTGKALPWVRFFSTPHPYEDFQGEPQLLFILVDDEAEERFHDIVQERCDEAGIGIPLFTTTRELIDGSDSFTDRVWYAFGTREKERCAPPHGVV